MAVKRKNAVVDRWRRRREGETQQIYGEEGGMRMAMLIVQKEQPRRERAFHCRRYGYAGYAFAAVAIIAACLQR